MPASIFERVKKANRERKAKRHAFAKVKSEFKLLESCKKSPISVSVANCSSSLFYFRPDSAGDRGVIKQMFGDRDYDLRQWVQGRALLNLAKHNADNGRQSLVLDAGANIGGAAVFFHQTIPQAKLICVEPDPANCQLCKKNTASTLSVILESALGSQIGEVKLFGTEYGDWGFRTGDVEGVEGLVVPSITVGKILDLHAKDSMPLIAKIDIEGAEAELFSANCEWMDVFPCIIIELHDWMLPGQGSSKNFFRQLVLRNYDVVYRGENMFLFNMGLIEERMKQYV